MSSSFEGLKIYYSSSIYGTPESDPEFAWKLVQYMIQNGADVLSEHVAARNKQEMDEIRTRRSGINLQEFQENSKPWFVVRQQDIKWVDEATHLIALVNSPSHGVGMEIQRAIDKPKFGMNETPILCLIHSELFSKLSFMIRGVAPEESSLFQIQTYNDLNQAQQHISDFLTARK